MATTAKSPDIADFALLHALLCRDAAADKVEVKRLLHAHHELVAPAAIPQSLDCIPM